MVKNEGLIKREEINRKLAAYFLSLEPGDNIRSIREFSKDCTASIGLISESIAHLEKLGAVEIERRGQLGSSLVSYSIGRLWNAALCEPLVISHTLPSNRRYEGLATALKHSFNSNGVEVYFIFIRGSRTRLKALREKRCHVAIMSRFAADGLCTSGENIPLTLPEGSFVKSHQVFYRIDVDPGKSQISAAIDPDSYDQTQLSYIEFENQEIEYRKITFMNIQRYLSEKKVDTAIWTEEDMQNQLGLLIRRRQLSESSQKIVGKDNIKATLVVRAEDEATGRLIKKALDKQEIIRIQQAVISGEMIPEY